MTKTLHIEGMMCAHCQAHVEKALNAIDGVEAKVNLETKTATLTLSKDVSDDVLTAAVTRAAPGSLGAGGCFPSPSAVTSRTRNSSGTPA